MARLKVVGGAADLFSYAALSREDEAEVRQVAERIKLRLRRTAEDIIEIGRDLTAMKEKLGHGQFLPWIEAEFDMSERYAQALMQIASVYGDKPAPGADLGFKALRELAAPSTPPEVRDQVEALVVDGQKVTAADVRRMKAEAQEAGKTSAGVPTPEALKRPSPALSVAAISAPDAEAIRREATEAGAAAWEHGLSFPFIPFAVAHPWRTMPKQQKAPDLNPRLSI